MNPTMKKPVFKYSKAIFIISAVLTIPLLIDICTACHLFPLWLAWFLFIIIGILSCVRLWFGFSQKCYKFAWGLIGQLLLGAGVLIFFQLSYANVIETPVSHPVTPAVVDIQDPIQNIDSINHADIEKGKEDHAKKEHNGKKQDDYKKSSDSIHHKPADQK